MNSIGPVAIPGYSLCEEIGRGGMGVVYRATDLAFDRDVAIKLLGDQIAADSFAAERFRNEARITGQLQHPGIPAAHELGTLADGKPFLAMKLVKGATLQAMLNQRGALAMTSGFIAIFEQICNAVGYAHAHDVIHRDLKPSNVMVGRFGEVQIMDWGLAKVVGEHRADEETEVDSLATAAFVGSAIETPAGADSATRTGTVLGTPAYMPPEQAGGQIRLLNAQSDVFGLGAILCEMLTGRPPYWASNLNDVRIKAVRGDLQESLELLDACPAAPDLVALAKKCLAFKQEERPANGQAVADEVGRIRTESEARAREAERERGESQVREAEGLKRRKQFSIAAGVIGAALLLGIAGTSYGLLQARQAASAERKAKEEAKAKQREAEQERTRAEQREQDAIDAVKRFGDAVANNAELKNSAHLESLRKELLKEPLGYFKSLRERLQSDNSTRPESLHRLASAAFELGELTEAIGDKEDAIRAYQEAKAIAERLARENPTVIVFRSHLADSHINLGNVLRDTGKPDEALAAYKAAQAIQERLGRENPIVTEFQSDLAVSHNNIGILLNETGKPAEALMAYKAAQAIQERLARENPTVTELQRALAMSHNNIGILLSDTGKPDEALAAYEAAKAIRERLARENPTVTVFQRDLAMSHNNLGLLLRETGKPAEALAAYHVAKAIQERLARGNPTVTEFRSDLMISQTNIGNLLSETGKVSEALAAYQAAKAIQERLARENPTVTKFQGSLAGTHNSLGALLHATGRRAEAAAAYKEAKGNLERLARENPTVIEFQSALAANYYNLGLLLQESGQLAQAQAAFEAAKATYERLARENPMVTEFQSQLAASHNNVGLLLQATGKPAEALTAYAAATAIRERLARENPTVVPFQNALAGSHYNLGNLLRESGKPAEALAAYEAAKSIREHLAQENPTVTRFQSMLGATLNNLALLKLDAGEFLAAKELLRNAVACQKRALADNPLHPDYSQFLKNHYGGLQIAAKGLNDPELEAEARRGLAELAASDPRYAALDQQLAAVAGGAPAKDAGELLALAERTYSTQQFALSARFYAEAMERDVSLAEDRQGHAYNAACCAALAADGRDISNPPLDDAAKEKLRRQALAWLQKELVACEKLLEKPESRPVIVGALQHWQNDPDLASVRDAEKLAALPEAERIEWEALWAKVKDVSTKAAEEAPPPSQAPPSL